MDRVYMENVDRYQALVKAYKPPKMGPKEAETPPNLDMIVSVRVRPLLKDELSSGIVPGVFIRGPVSAGGRVIDLHELRKTVRWGPQINSFQYKIDHVFGPDDTTEEVYDAFVKPLIPWAWAGGIGTLFAYGQTGSGKTFTISGIEHLVAETLWGGDLEGERNVFCSIIELAGQSAFDLLDSRKPIQVLEDSFGTTQLAGALELQVESKESLLGYIERAVMFRKSARTMKNDDSSRSHAICRIRIENPALPAAEAGALYLVDLAGSEAARDTRTHGAERMRETREINTSLSVLKDCIRGRADADATPFMVTGGKVVARKPHIPFRQSTLTKVLKHVFDPAATRSCKTAVVACVNPSFLDVGPTKNTLRYAETLRVLVPKSNAVEYNPSVPVTWSNGHLRQWIDRNSGTPPIPSELLAPSENGSQMLRLPVPEFLTRCLKTPGVKLEQAKAFRAKLWRLHVDSQKMAAANPSEPRISGRNTSRDPEPGTNSVPFKQRIRPGMVIQWNPPEAFTLRQLGPNYAVILCSQSAVETKVRDAVGKEVLNPGPRTGSEDSLPRKYLCSIVKPGAMIDSYEVMLWQQVVIDIEEMETEVLLEYDGASRYYAMTL